MSKDQILQEMGKTASYMIKLAYENDINFLALMFKKQAGPMFDVDTRIVMHDETSSMTTVYAILSAFQSAIDEEPGKNPKFEKMIKELRVTFSAVMHEQRTEGEDNEPQLQ